MLGRLLVAATVLFAWSSVAFGDTGYWAVKYHDHSRMQELRPFVYSYLDKARVQIVTFRAGVTLASLPKHLREFLRPIDPAVMSVTPVSDNWLNVKVALGLKQKDARIVSLLEEISDETVRATVSSLVDFGKRTTNASTDWIMETLVSYGYQPVYDYNIEAVKIGKTKPDEIVIIEGHMDTVSNTVGADDNATGAAGVLEAARVLANIETERTIVFLITEDEERGLLGAKRYVRNLRNEGRLAQVKFVVNMDMIGYNSNGIVDLESEPQFEDLLDWMAEQTMLYTTLEPNKILQAWGSDHVPFIDAGVPALLTIEHWNTHTPCWHRSCDTIDTVNFAYAAQIARLNAAAISLKAGLL